MCDRKNIKNKMDHTKDADHYLPEFTPDKYAIPDDMMNRLIDHAINGLKSSANKKVIALTADMIINDQEFGETLATRPSAKELGEALVRANKLGLRVIRGGK